MTAHVRYLECDMGMTYSKLQGLTPWREEPFYIRQRYYEHDLDGVRHAMGREYATRHWQHAEPVAQQGAHASLPAAPQRAGLVIDNDNDRCWTTIAAFSPDAVRAALRCVSKAMRSRIDPLLTDIVVTRADDLHAVANAGYAPFIRTLTARGWPYPRGAGAIMLPPGITALHDTLRGQFLSVFGPQLQHLPLRELSLTSPDGNMLAGILTACPGLQHLSIRNWTTTEDFCRALQCHPALTYLSVTNARDYTGNNLDLRLGAAIAGNSTLTQIEMGHSRYPECASMTLLKPGLRAFRYAMGMSPVKKPLNEDQFQLINSNPTLTALELTNDYIGYPDLFILSQNTRLTALSLPMLATSLIALDRLCGIKTLHALCVGVDGPLDAYYVRNIVSHPQIRRLELRCQEVRDDGAAALASSSTLTALSLPWSQHLPAAASLAIASNRSLTELSFGTDQHQPLDKAVIYQAWTRAGRSLSRLHNV